MSRTPCMGGFCALRDHCAHYHADSLQHPAERLCIPGQDGQSDVVAVVMSKPMAPWERMPASSIFPMEMSKKAPLACGNWRRCE